MFRHICSVKLSSATATFQMIFNIYNVYTLNFILRSAPLAMDKGQSVSVLMRRVSLNITTVDDMG